jgi:hypothetical protein
MNMNLYSATMLVKYIKCNHIISNDFNEKKLKLKRNTRTVADKLRLEKGLLHEAWYFSELKKNIQNLKI